MSQRSAICERRGTPLSAIGLLIGKDTSVWISRLRVTGGFLEGLDVRLESGLNVVIGARGAGKTTLLELIGHALGTSHADQKRHDAEVRRVRSMLGDGEVVLDIEDGDSSYRLVVDAEGGGRRPEFAEAALVLGQNELEAIASDADSRLRLIDFRAKSELGESDIGEIASITQQLFALGIEIREIEERISLRALLQSDLDNLTNEEKSLMSDASASLTTQREILRSLENSLLEVQSQQNVSEYAVNSIHDLTQTYARLLDQANRLVDIPLPPDDNTRVRPSLVEFHASVVSLNAHIDAASERLSQSRARRAAVELELRAQAEPIRSELNTAERGLGELTTKIRRVRAELERLDAEKVRSEELTVRYNSLHAERGRLLDSAEQANEELYLRRRDIANAVSQDLSSRITVTIEHLADARAFRDLLATSLQGSGMRYGSIADLFSKNLLPRQLLDFVERGDVDAASAATELSTDRVSRALDALRNSETLSALSIIQLDDMADFLLQDGSMQKSVETLSTGQKCAVTLPILLTEHARPLLLDQPEDHLDNAFLVDTVVVGLNKRSVSNAQTVIATHNANIPVLGSAAKVIQLVSDGRRGEVEVAGPYDAPAVVEAITNLMEGGEDAFRRRAEFYRDHGFDT